MFKWRYHYRTLPLCLFVFLTALLLTLSGAHAQTVPLDQVVFLLNTGDAQQRIQPFYDLDEHSVYLFLPSFAQSGSLSISDLPAGYQIQISDVFYQSGDTLKWIFDQESPVQIYDENGLVIQQGSICFMHGSQLPALFISTESGTLDYIQADKRNKEPGTITLLDSNGSTAYDGKLKHIKGRGNSTWGAPKKPYKLKLISAQNLLGLGKNNEWVLLANYTDPAYIRNMLVLSFGLDIGLSDTPHSIFCELYLNGVYQGLYQLTEKIEVGNAGLDIDLATSDHIDGGYLLESTVIERVNEEEDTYFTTNDGRALLINEPSDASDDLVEYISSYVQDAENSLYPGNDLDYIHYFDTFTWVRTYILNEIFANQDGGNFSVFMYTDGIHSTLFSGPPWDFDLSIGNGYTLVRNPKLLFAGTSMWYKQLYAQPSFYDEVISEYRELCLPLLDTYLYKKINWLADAIEASVLMDKLRWKDEAASVFTYKPELGYQQQIGYLKDFLIQRRDFLKDLWINGIDYCYITLDLGESFMEWERYYTYTIKEGETFYVPFTPSKPDTSFTGWRVLGTDESFQANKPITVDHLVLYATWSSSNPD